MTSEQRYIASTPIEHRKKYAQFFTPKSIATFMCKWVMQGKQKSKVLEPAYGLGVFSHILTQSITLPIDAYEIDSKIYSFAINEQPYNVSLRNEDYFNSSWEAKYDAILCNPPYLKFHDYDNSTYIANINNHLGINLSGFTNLYTLFLLKSISQLKQGGRLAYIIPSEFLNSDYGIEVKRALIKSKTLKHIVILDFKECAFDDVLTTACIILCENTKSDTIRFSTLTDITKLDECLNKYSEFKIKEIDTDTKWKTYYSKSYCTKYHHLVPFSKFARVSRGIATGANDYFTFKQSKINKYNIPEECLIPCICKAIDVQNIFFTLNDYKKLTKKDKTTYLFNGCINNDNEAVNRYIKVGEQLEVNKRYLTASRKPWYSVENRPSAPIWVTVFNRNGLRFIRNEANVSNLTAFHCVYPKEDIDTDVLFAYLVTNVAKEIFTDNSRQYGNGLVKFEPNDLNKGYVVDLSLLTIEEVRYIKKLYSCIKYSKTAKAGIELLNNFFYNKFTTGIINLDKDKEVLKVTKYKSIILPSNISNLRIDAPNKEQTTTKQYNDCCNTANGIFVSEENIESYPRNNTEDSSNADHIHN